MKRKMYVYGVAGLATAALGASVAGGLFSDSDEGEQPQGSTTLAGQAVAPPVKAPQVAPPKAAAPVVPAVPAAKPAPVTQLAKVKRDHKPRDHQPVVQRKANPVRKATTQTPRIVQAAAAVPATRPVVRGLPMQAAVAKPAGDSVTEAKKRLDAAEGSLSKAKGLIDQAEDHVEKAESDVKKVKDELKKIKKTKHDKGKHDKGSKPKQATNDKAGKGSNKVEVSLSSADVKPGQSRTITKSTPDGSSTSTVTVTRGA